MYLIESLRRDKRVVKTIGNLSQNVNDFSAILYENSKIPFFDLKFLVSGPTGFLLRSTFQQEVAKSVSLREKSRKLKSKTNLLGAGGANESPLHRFGPETIVGISKDIRCSA